MRLVVFLDRDGTIIHDAHYLGDPDRVTPIDGAVAAVARLRARGATVVVVTNQSGIARGLITMAQYEAVEARVDSLIPVDATYMCPHHPDLDGPCACRKPGAELYQRAILDLGIENPRIVLIGDKWRDLAAGDVLGGYGILVPSTETSPEDLAEARVTAPTLNIAVTMALQPRIAVLASGGGTNMEAIAERVPLALVASNRADAGALARAARRGIPTEVIEDPADADAMLQMFRRHGIELVALAGYLKKVPEAVTRAFRGRMLNIHPALLPKFGGPGMYGERVHAAVLAAGDTESGATVHFVDADYDRGPIIAQRRVAVEPGDTVETLAKRVLAVEHDLYPEVVDAVASGRITLGQP